MTSIRNEFQTKGINDVGQDIDEFEAPDVSPQEQAEHTAQRTAAALEATKLIEIVEVKASPGQVHMLGRVRKDNERPFMDLVVWPILRAMEHSDADGFVGKQFFLKNDAGKYGWVISFASNNLKNTAYEVAEALDPALPHVEVMEAPLQGPGTPQNGGQSSGRRGASPVR